MTETIVIDLFCGCGRLSKNYEFAGYDVLIDIDFDDVAYIKPQAHNGKFLPCNGIAMNRDMHFAFAKGFFTIGNDYRVTVSERLQVHWFYKEYNDTEIYVLEVEFCRFEKRFFHYRQQHIFNTLQK